MGSSEYWSSDFHIQAKEGEKLSGSRLNQPCNKVFPLGFLVSETHLASQEAAGRGLAPAILIACEAQKWLPQHVSYSLSHTLCKLLRQEPTAQGQGRPDYHHCHQVRQRSTGNTQRQGQLHSIQRADTTKSTFATVILTPQVLGQSTVKKTGPISLQVLCDQGFCCSTRSYRPVGKRHLAHLTGLRVSQPFALSH